MSFPDLTFILLVPEDAMGISNSISYPADELDTSLAWVDATIDFYSNLEIVCFKTKEIQDAYASQWGIVPYN